MFERERESGEVVERGRGGITVGRKIGRNMRQLSKNTEIFDV